MLSSKDMPISPYTKGENNTHKTTLWVPWYNIPTEKINLYFKVIQVLVLFCYGNYLQGTRTASKLYFILSTHLAIFPTSLMSSIYIRWLIFSFDLLSLYTVVHFLSMWLNSIMAIMNSNGDNASSWNIPLCLFASAKLLPPAVNSTLQVFKFFSIQFMTSCDILYILRQFII